MSVFGGGALLDGAFGSEAEDLPPCPYWIAEIKDLCVNRQLATGRAVGPARNCQERIRTARKELG